MHGKSTFSVRVTECSDTMLMLELDGPDTGPFALKVSFAEYPEFERQDRQKVCMVQRPHPDHLYWPLLDVDLSLSGLKNPSLFPLAFQPERVRRA
ncbi:MAG: hypothetical protein RLZZ290_176 [Pseudomonadota bacterium]|jgi:hypothetical protein